jgi:hypothetical protein
MFRYRDVAASVFILAVGSFPALAWATGSHHFEQRSVKPIRDASGRTVGARFTVTLRPDASYGRVIVGLGDPSRVPDGNRRTQYRHAEDRSLGYALHHFPPVENLTQPTELRLEVRYGNGINGGQKLDLLSAWFYHPTPNLPTGVAHVWGMSRGDGHGVTITLPR